MRTLFPMPGGFSVARCEACGLARTLPEVPAAEIGRYYPPSYYGVQNRRFHPLLEWAVTVFRKRRVWQIQRFVATGRALDVGCGRGITLSQLRDEGWATAGVEISETAAAQARAALGDSIFVGDVVEGPWEPESFDVVVLWHVLEHLPDPFAVLAKTRQLLRPGGLLVIAVPNLESLQALATGGRWFHLDVPRHYWHFGTRILTRLLEAKGFRIRNVSHFSLEQNPYGWLQSLLNRAGFPPNLLYDILKRRSARDVVHPFRRHPVASILLAPALVVAFPVSLVLTLVEAALRRGGTIEIYAERRE